jgi:hypothetical protein
MLIDLNAGDCRLGANSPCINAGLNQDWMNGAIDLDGHSRIDRYSRIVDMGCFVAFRINLPYGVLIRPHPAVDFAGKEALTTLGCHSVPINRDGVTRQA